MALFADAPVKAKVAGLERVGLVAAALDWDKKVADIAAAAAEAEAGVEADTPVTTVAGLDQV